MKIHTRFFITFFCFALFFSFSSYLAQDSLFKFKENAEKDKAEKIIIQIKGQLREDLRSENDSSILNPYLEKVDSTIDVVSYNSKRNEILDAYPYSTTRKKVNEIAAKVIDDYQTVETIKSSCQQIKKLPNQTKSEKPRDFMGDYIIQSFCQDNKIYIVTSHYERYEKAISLLQQSYVAIFAVTIILSAILSYILARYISTPITKISYVTKKLSNLDFSNRVEVIGNDEIGELATNINILSDKLQHSIQKLRDGIIIEKENNERQVQLFASMSHELKTPITILKGTLEGIKDQIGPYKNPLNFVDDMIEETNNMENIVLNLLSYAKFSVNDVSLKLTPYHLEDLIDDTIDRLSYLINENEIMIETNIVDDLVDVDLPSISMALKNILENAIYYSKKQAKVEIFASSFTDHVLIQVYNHNVNIEHDHILHIFEPFYRADDSRIKYKNGTGLGLTIVKQILEQHQSNFSLYNVNNDDEYAVCFEFTLKKSKKTKKTIK